MPADAERIAVIGLGYVGLPLAVGLARHYDVVGFDIGTSRVAQLRAGHDRTGEVEAAVLRESSLALSADVADLAGADIFIITVPTPVDEDNKPDLSALLGACEMVGAHLRVDSVVVLESTVYPGVTEEICGPALEQASGLVCGQDFFLGYSPERINPGDREHTVDRITKVLAGQTPVVRDRLAKIYGNLTSGGVYLVPDIKTAEAAKVIENAQRDINIAFVNEVAAICQHVGISAYDVLDAAGSKWNFLPFTPGLVGGHCIGVDPYYLAFRAQQLGHDPQIVLAGRRLNDAMGAFIAARIDERLEPGSRILVLGLTFKENVPDLRNSKVVDLVRGLQKRGHAVELHDRLADRAEAMEAYDLQLLEALPTQAAYDAVVLAVPHDRYGDMSAQEIAALLTADGLVADIKGIWRGLTFEAGLRRWQL